MASIPKLIECGNVEAISKLKNLSKLIKGTVSGIFDTQSIRLSNPSMIQLAAAYHREDVVEYLLKWDADPNYLSAFLIFYDVYTFLFNVMFFFFHFLECLTYCNSRGTIFYCRFTS